MLNKTEVDTRYTMKRIKALLVFTLLTLVGCSSSQETKTPPIKKGGIQAFRYNIQEEPTTLDPRKVSSLRDVNVCIQLMEGLFTHNKEGTLSPALVSSYTLSDDKKTYTFTLRDAKWSNGDPITASDVVYSWKSVLHPSFPAPHAHLLYSISNAKAIKQGSLPPSLLGVQATGEKTLSVTLSDPSPRFLETLTSPVSFPVHKRTDETISKWTQSPDTYVASGPFTLGEWKHNYSITLKRNDQYYQPVHLNQVEMVMVSAETELTMFEAGELDWAGSPLSSIPKDRVAYHIDQGTVSTAPFFATKMLRINTTHPLLASAKIRKALSLAINREELTDVLHGVYSPAFSLSPEGLQAGLEDIAISALFHEGLEELGKAPSDFDNITVSFYQDDNNKQVAETIQQQWKQVLGISVNVQAADTKVLLDAMNTKQYDLAISSWVADYNNPMAFLEVFRTKETSSNRTGWESEAYQHILDQLAACTNEDQQKQLVTDSEMILRNEAPFIPLWHYSQVYMKKDSVKDVALSPLGRMQLKWAHIE